MEIHTCCWKVDLNHTHLGVVPEVSLTVYIRCYDTTRQPVFGVIGNVESLIIIANTLDRSDRAKYLFPINPHFLRRSRKECRFQIVAVWYVFRALSTMDQLGAFSATNLNIILVDLKLLGADNRTHLCLRIARIADHQA